MSLPWFLEVLALPTHADERAVRRAYAMRVKLIDPATDPAAFARLREAYEAARAWVADEDHDVVVEQAAPFVSDVVPPLLPASPADREKAAVAEEVNPQEQAIRLVDRFAARVAQGLDDDVRRELEACTAELRLQYIDAPGIFEDLLIDRLARGLIARRVAVFAHASDIFHWQELGHLTALGPKGMWIEAVESQRMAWAALPPLVRASRLALIERAEASKGVLSSQIVRRWVEVRDDLRRFPAYLSLYLTLLRQQEWASCYDALPATERQAIEAPAKTRRMRIPAPVWLVVVIVVLGVLTRPSLYQNTLEHRPGLTAATSVPATSAPMGENLASDLQVTLAGPVDAATRDEAWIVVTLTNRGRSPLYLRKALTPPMTPGGHVGRPLFTIIDEHGARPRFRGLEDPDHSTDPASFYIRLDPGQTLTNTVDLSIDYDLVPESRYTIRYTQPVAGSGSVDAYGTPHDQSGYVASNTFHMNFRGWGQTPSTDLR
jgi:hypothetical protein